MLWSRWVCSPPGSPAQRHAAALAMLMLTLAVCEPDLAHLTTAQAQGRFAPTDSLSPLSRFAQARPACLHSPAEARIASLVAHTLTDLDQGA